MVDRHLHFLVIVVCGWIQLTSVATELLPFNTAEVLALREEFAYKKTLQHTITFNGASYDTVYINEDGALSFDQTFITVAGTNRYRNDVTWIAPYGADVDGNGVGSLHFETLDSTATGILAIISQYIDTEYSSAIFTATGATIITWYNVQQYQGSPTATNTFQAVLATDGASSYVLFLYETIAWSPAVVGINGGDSINKYLVCDTHDDEARLLPWKSSSSCGTRGVLILPVDTTSWTTSGSACSDVYTPIDCTYIGVNTNRNSRCGLS